MSWRSLVSEQPLSWRLALLGALVSGGLTAVVSRPVTGAVVAVVTLAAGRLRWGRLLLRGGAVGTLLVLIGYAVVEQVRYHYLPTIDWPAQLSSANDIAWLAICLLGADVVVGALRATTTHRGGYRSHMRGFEQVGV